jgi:WD40 repeat protein
MLLYSFEEERIIKSRDIHKKEIMSFTVTHDHTMLVTCSKDGYAKLLNPRTLEIITVFDFEGKPCRSASISPLFESQAC